MRIDDLILALNGIKGQYGPGIEVILTDGCGCCTWDVPPAPRVVVADDKNYIEGYEKGTRVVHLNYR